MISDSERAYLADLVMLQIENDSSNSSYIIYPDELQGTYGISREEANAVLDEVLRYEEILDGYIGDDGELDCVIGYGYCHYSYEPFNGDEEQYMAERDKTESDIRKRLSFRTKTDSEGRCFLESRYCGKVVEREEVKPRRGEQVIAKAMLSSRRIVVNEINGEYASIRKEYEKKMQKSDLSPKKMKEGREH